MDLLAIIVGAVIGAALFRARPRRVIRATARLLEPRLLQRPRDPHEDVEHH